MTVLETKGKRITLRRACPGDKARIEELFIEMLQTIYQKEDVAGHGEDDLARFFQGAGDWICVAEAEGRVEAFLSMEEHHEAETYLYLDDFSVSASCRGLGIGTALLETAYQYAKEKGIPQVVLHVVKSNARARSLYGRMGYKDERDDGDRILMKKLV